MRTFRMLAYATVCLLFVLAGCKSDKSGQAAPPTSTATAKASPANQTFTTHTVQKGEFLKSIAPLEKVDWERILLMNEPLLKQKYEETCPKFDANLERQEQAARHIKNRKARARALKHIETRKRTLFCNDRYNRPYGNTLLPGWVLKIPPTAPPAQITQTVEKIKGNRVALVIDDTGSMTDDTRFVGQFYTGALHNSGKQITGIFLFADGNVRRYNPDASVQFLHQGQRENTHMALQEATKDKPDAIILITDEPGDDWKWPWIFGMGLPPVYGHCLPERGVFECRDNLTKLASKTGGKYIEHDVKSNP